MTVEDVLELLCHHLWKLRASQWAERFIANVAQHTIGSRPLSTEQSRIIIKLATTYRAFLLNQDVDAQELDQVIQSPVHRLPPYKSSNIPREVRYIGDNKLAFRFKFNDMIINEIKLLKPRSHLCSQDQYPTWNPDHRMWVISVTRDTVDRVIKLISLHRFRFDVAVAEYLTLCVNSKDQPSSFALDANGNIKINVCDNEFLANWAQSMLGATPT